MASNGAAALLHSHALKLLSSRLHTRAELVSKLTRLCVKRKSAKRASLREEYANADCRACVTAALGMLGASNSIDDVAYSDWHVQQRAAHRQRSKLQLRSELYVRGVAPADSSAALSEYDELAAAVVVAGRKQQRQPPEAVVKSLRTMGFPGAVASAAASIARGASGHMNELDDDGAAVDSRDLEASAGN